MLDIVAVTLPKRKVSTRSKKLNGKAREETQAPGEQPCKEKRQKHLNTYTEKKETAKDAEKISRELHLVSKKVLSQIFITDDR